MKQTKVFILVLVLAACALVGGWLATHPAKPAAKAGSAYRAVPWADLASFKYEPSVHPKRKAPPKPVKIPESVACLNGQSVQLAGYMIPVDVDGHKVLAFVLVKDQQACCYGRSPAMNEFVFVRLHKGMDLDLQMDVPIQVTGNFEVGEDIQEGAVISLYRMVADSVSVVEGKQAGWKAN